MRDTIEMAREADEYADMEWPLRPRGERWQKCRDERFEALVRADEREACANLLDSTDLSAMSADPKLQNWTAALLFQYAAAIRARGETK
jgi:hypothetical protein